MTRARVLMIPERTAFGWTTSMTSMPPNRITCGNARTTKRRLTTRQRRSECVASAGAPLTRDQCRQSAIRFTSERGVRRVDSHPRCRHVTLMMPGVACVSNLENGEISGSHAEVRAAHRRDGGWSAADFDCGRVLTPEEVEQQFAWWPREACGRVPSACPQNLAGACPFEFEAVAAQSSCEPPRCDADVAPQCLVQRGGVGSGLMTVRAANILMVHEELVEVRDAAHPPDAEETARWTCADRRDQRGVVGASERLSVSFCEPAPRAGHHESRCGAVIVLADD